LAQGEIKPTERTSVRRLIIGMAVGWYGYNPNIKRNEAIREIFDVLKKLGIPRDMDTVRDWLQKSAEELPPDWEQGNRS
jgi:transposase-like protein